MMMHVTGMAILSARSTRSRFASPPERSSARMNRVQLPVPHLLRDLRGLAIMSIGRSVKCRSRMPSNAIAKIVGVRVA